MCRGALQLNRWVTDVASTYDRLTAGSRLGGVWGKAAAKHTPPLQTNRAWVTERLVAACGGGHPREATPIKGALVGGERDICSIRIKVQSEQAEIAKHTVEESLRCMTANTLQAALTDSAGHPMSRSIRARGEDMNAGTQEESEGDEGLLSPPASRAGCGTTGLHMPVVCRFSAHGFHMVQSTAINPSQLRLAAADSLLLPAGLAPCSLRS
ncbi:hypothetical protein SRHO_G00172730 [Serrasalmus rhombeus]